MSSRSFSLTLASAACLAPWALCAPAAAPDEGLGALAASAQAAMKAGQWDVALAACTRAVETFGAKNPMQAFGPQFGAVYHHKGVCEMKLKRWDDAMKSFEICYRDFPNTAAAAENANSFQKLALLRWGEAAMGAGKWELALEKFRKFLLERDRKRDVFLQGPLHIGMAVCHYRLGDIPEGNEDLEIALRNKAGFPTPDEGIAAAFEALVGAAVSAGNEQALLDFITKNRGELETSPSAMQRFAGVFLKLAGDAATAGMHGAALRIYQLVPSTESVMADIRSRLAAMGPMESVKDGGGAVSRKQLEAESAELEKQSASGITAEALKLSGVALIHERFGNIRGAFAIYQELEADHSTSANRGQNLFHLVRTAALVSSSAETRRHAEEFLKSFPTSPQAQAVRRILLTKLHGDRDHQACIEVATPMLDSLKPDSPERDLCLHVLGAALFHSGRFADALPLLEKHAESHPDSPFAAATAWLLAADLTALGRWQEAAVLLDAFLEQHAAERELLPLVLLDRAKCHQHEKQFHEALAKLTRLVSEFPESGATGEAFHLTGEIESQLGAKDKAAAAHESALGIAEKRGDSAAAAASLEALVVLSGDAPRGDPRLKKAAAYADRFWKDHAGTSAAKPRVAIAEIPAYAAAGRMDEALRRLQEAIVEAASGPSRAVTTALIQAHASAFLEKHTPADLKALYHGFPGIRADDVFTRSELRDAVIAAFEKRAAAGDEAAKPVVKALYQELKTGFAMKDLSNRLLVRIGDHLRLATSTPREALPFYDEVIGREDADRRMAALLGRADVFSASSAPADAAKAAEDFKRVARESADQAERDYALGRIKQTEAAGK